MAQLRNDYNGFIARTSEVIVIGPDSPEAFNAYWIKNHMPFIGLLDPTHATLKRYGQQVKLFKLGRMPAQIIINQKGRVRYVHYGRSMTDIPVNADIFNVLDNLNAETTAGPENA